MGTEAFCDFIGYKYNTPMLPVIILPKASVFTMQCLRKAKLVVVIESILVLNIVGVLCQGKPNYQFLNSTLYATTIIISASLAF